jgi:hypothetical protein
MTEDLLWVNPPAWQLEKHGDYTKFFSKLVDLGFPQGSYLVLESTSLNTELAKYLKPYLVKSKHTGGLFKFLFSEIQYFHVPLNPETMSRLFEFSKTCAAPEICNHLVVIHGDETLLHWYDFPDDPIHISGSISEDAISSFAATLGSEYRREETAV